MSLDASWPGRVVSINWGPWAGVGMASPEIQRQFLERQIVPIDPREGRHAFDKEIGAGRKGDVTIVLGNGPWAAGATDVATGRHFAALS